ncbi:MAG: tetratricopeptide repeat protein [Gammaproteobacteria bacterium]
MLIAGASRCARHACANGRRLVRGMGVVLALLGTLGIACGAMAQPPATSPSTAQSEQRGGSTAVVRSAGGPSVYYRRAKQYQARKDYTKYFKWLRKAARAGSVKAQDVLGFDYALGHRLPQDYRKAVFWYRRAAAQHDPQAQCELGLEYAHGLGVKKNRARAVKLYREAASQGYQPARTLLPY